jgi:hypothetical protein
MNCSVVKELFMLNGNDNLRVTSLSEDCPSAPGAEEAEDQRREIGYGFSYGPMLERGEKIALPGPFQVSFQVVFRFRSGLAESPLYIL